MFPFSKEIRVKLDEDRKIREFVGEILMRIRFSAPLFSTLDSRELSLKQSRYESSRLRTVHISSLRRCNENLVQINCD